MQITFKPLTEEPHWFTTQHRAVRCSCGHRACKDWHVAPSADAPSVKFTQEEAEAVAKLLNTLHQDYLKRNPVK